MTNDTSSVNNTSTVENTTTTTSSSSCTTNNNTVSNNNNNTTLLVSLYCPELDTCIDPYAERCPLDIHGGNDDNDNFIQTFVGPQRLLCFSVNDDARCDLSETTTTTTSTTEAMESYNDNNGSCSTFRLEESILTGNDDNEEETQEDTIGGLKYVTGLIGVYYLPEGCTAICYGCDIDPIRLNPTLEPIILPPSSATTTTITTTTRIGTVRIRPLIATTAQAEVWTYSTTIVVGLVLFLIYW